ncbi:ABC transporter ATP-binding protein/permease [Clostridium sp. CS001]|uniref:ABC transporter ATP-binding protein n=1 Tax=Clostridium sp. CS001 TaxID=2880648 RepID=UPI001CF33C4D|nr:ABC transporter ATP-binding protein [Clostridium sp. CS001]MCB2289393.1 ABC transporter ATP-binding protein/permease [Clostridium sp. CS001]
MEIKIRNYKVADYIGIPLKIAPVTVIGMGILRVLIALIPSFQVLTISKFIDTAIDIFKNGSMTRIYIPLFALMIFIGFSWVSSVLHYFMRLKLDLKMNQRFRPAVVKKRSRLCYEHIENNDTWDLIARVGEDPSEQIMKGLNNLFNIVEYIVKILGLMIIIAAQVWWVAIAIIAIALPLFALASKSGKVDYEAYSEAEKYRRKADYLKEVLSSRESVEERALFGYTKEIDKKWFDRYETARKIEFKAMKGNFIKMKTASIITATISMAIALVLLTPVSKGLISVGMYMGLVTAAFSLVQQMSWELSVVMQEYTKNKLYLKDLTAFSHLKEVEGADALPDMLVQKMPFESIEFKNVHFSYPGTDRVILKGLSMRLERDKQYAFVGKNGAGKTTITKLLTGLYDNYQGDILINGKNIRSFTQEQLKAYFAVVYQDFAKYQITLKDNVLLGNCGQVQHQNKQTALVEKALHSMEMDEDVKKLPKGIDTHLGKLTEEGMDLSGGQWQRVAIARTLVSNAPVYILDEPTAALDPISESKLYKLFGKVSKGKSIILITHRLGAARSADEILVVDDGFIAESGSHAELLNKSGIYAEMFKAQRSWYNEQGA